MGPRYPIYIPSKGRADKTFAAQMFLKDGVDFRIVVEPQEVAAYSTVLGREHVLSLPMNNQGLVYARNWIRDHAVSEGYERHWQFDDDIYSIMRLYRGYRIRCTSKVAIVAAEDFVDRYENAALASLNSWFFILSNRGMSRVNYPPFYLNHRCYSCFLMLNSLPYRWRGQYNEDADMTLQVLSGGWCTILFNAFLIQLPATMTHGGGQTPIYTNDGRLHMSRELERVWPGVVTTSRRFRRPQHRIKGEWRFFDTKLIKKAGLEIGKEPNEYGLKLKAISEVKSEILQKLLEETR